MPYLICMGSDIDNNIRLKADQQLQEIDKKYPGFIQMKAMHGVKMSYRLQELLQQSAIAAAAAATLASSSSSASACTLLRGVRLEDNNYVSLNSYIYSLIRSNRGQRRALLTTALNMFDDTTKTPLSELIYMADNLAYFPYQQQDEPLFIIHQIDIIVSVSGSNLIQSFREVFYPGPVEGPSGSSSVVIAENNHQPDEDDEDVDTLLGLMPEDVAPVQELFLASQGCILLLVLKQHLKDMYSFTDNKIQRYSLTDTKTFDKPVNRKNGVKFNPKQALELVRHGPLSTELDEDGRRELLQQFLDFKELMLSIDRDENDDDDDRPNGPLTQGALALTANATDVDPTEPGDGTTAASTSTTCPVTGMIGRPSSSSIHTNRLKNPSLHKLSSSEKRRGRPPGSSSTSASSRPKPPKPPKHKRKKKRYNVSDSEADSDDGDSDPDWG
jgi:cohesin loading factor subunit SCC2